MRVHHIGIVCSNIKEYIKQNEFIWQNVNVSEVIYNKVQKVNECFINFENEVSIELLEPLGEKSPVFKFLESGGGMHHICYQVENINQAIKDSREKGAIVVCKPIPDIAFEGGLIAFIKYEKNLIEFLQKN